MKRATIAIALICALSVSGCAGFPDLLSTSTSGVRLLPEQELPASESAPAGPHDGGAHWVVDEDGNRHWFDGVSNARGLYRIEGQLYFFDPAGNLRTGWQYVDEHWYLFSDLDAALPGAAVTGWIPAGETWYHLNEETCAMDVGWVEIDGSWYFFAPDGTMTDGWLTINGTTYHLAGGEMSAGWLLDGNDWYYLDPETGEVTVGWRFIGGSWYYFNAEGKMQHDVWQDGYYLLGTGVMAYDWQQIGGRWYYFDSNGTRLHDRWIDNYYLGSDGAMLTNQRTPDGYLVGPDGAWVTTGEGSVVGDPGTERLTVGAHTTSTSSQGTTLRTVYFAQGSTVYHYDAECRDLYGARVVMQSTLAQALANNYSACTICVN